MTLSVDLPMDVLTRLRLEANRRGVSIDVVIAELVALLPPDQAATTKRPLSFIAMGTSTSGRSARDADIMLAEGFGRD